VTAMIGNRDVDDHDSNRQQ
jgi:hypothetical protein